MKLQNTNELETAINTNFGNWELEDELSDADLMAINGGSILGDALQQVGDGVSTLLFPLVQPAGLLGQVGVLLTGPGLIALTAPTPDA